MVSRDLMRMCLQCGELFIVEESIYFEDCREACSFCLYCPLHGQRAMKWSCPDLLPNDIDMLRMAKQPPHLLPPAVVRTPLLEQMIRYRIRTSSIAA